MRSALFFRAKKIARIEHQLESHPSRKKTELSHFSNLRFLNGSRQDRRSSPVLKGRTMYRMHAPRLRQTRRPNPNPRLAILPKNSHHHGPSQAAIQPEALAQRAAPRPRPSPRRGRIPPHVVVVIESSARSDDRAAPRRRKTEASHETGGEGPARDTTVPVLHHPFIASTAVRETRARDTVRHDEDSVPVAGQRDTRVAGGV